ncbi:TRAP transporter substrate-binding protein [uncultured Sphaerochaeta sp.]|uniref:TRAP transporter substrate-binding protein n=1 Tax=uncultured Sphaerochaeta sp. TaxID=886478 RepID=UPI002A0A8F86|nr:TRAP transporter substrate-binding protein [uncultured Sphaerochaeta sp.]
MKKMLLAVFVAALVLTGCTKQTTPANVATEVTPTTKVEKVYKIKVGHEFTTESPRHKALLVYKKYLEETSNGRLSVEIYPAGILGKEAEMIESEKMGNLECFVGGPFDPQTEKLNLILMPFFFQDQDALMRVSQSEIGEAIRKDGEKNNLKLLAFGNGGSRQITNNVHEIKSPADMKGLKIRTPGMESIIKCMSELGANPVSIPYADTYMALKTGVADGQENPLANIGDMKFYEVQKYMTYINYQFHPEVISMNLKFYNNLPEDLQKIVTDGAWIFTKEQNKLRLEMDDKYYKLIEDSGVKIYKPTEAERQQFIAACAPVYDYFIQKGTFTQEELDAVRKVALGN